jgi:hypothetical protein
MREAMSDEHVSWLREPAGAPHPILARVETLERLVVRAQHENAALRNLLARMHERLIDGRRVPSWAAAWAEEIEAALAVGSERRRQAGERDPGEEG